MTENWKQPSQERARDVPGGGIGVEEGWAPGGGLGSPEKGPGGSPPAALPRGRVGMAGPSGGDLGKRRWSRHGAVGVCLGNKTEGENGGGTWEDIVKAGSLMNERWEVRYQLMKLPGNFICSPCFGRMNCPSLVRTPVQFLPDIG